VTPATVPIRDLLDFARLVKRMRDCQQDYFKARREQPHANLGRLFDAAKDAERRVDAAIAEALERDRRTIPGME
jgi:hypothetical protein